MEVSDYKRCRITKKSKLSTNIYVEFQEEIQYKKFYAIGIDTTQGCEFAHFCNTFIGKEIKVVYKKYMVSYSILENVGLQEVSVY